ncbi:hypothetical protein AWZ03_004769 [Drosophila navojoa]|uniref:Uncharacterized protein n=1 Tax=Drosophila navojoa TaxID=7232 RepID=A0A484BJ25_DRONA|nr:hypothetical protein AWZ03_004769 [Drosophila navojoa]
MSSPCGKCNTCACSAQTNQPPRQEQCGKCGQMHPQAQHQVNCPSQQQHQQQQQPRSCSGPQQQQQQQQSTCGSGQSKPAAPGSRAADVHVQTIDCPCHLRMCPTNSNPTTPS